FPRRARHQRRQDRRARLRRGPPRARRPETRCRQILRRRPRHGRGPGGAQASPRPPRDHQPDLHEGRRLQTAGGQVMGKNVYFFGGGHAEGKSKGKELLGGKGAGLAEMTELGIPVPPGFTITTEVCTAFYGNALAGNGNALAGKAAGGKLPDGLPGELREAM